jgi:maleylpyruvate isomerase
MSAWARWRETEIHHVDLDTGYTHSHWPAEFVDLLLPRVRETLTTRLDAQTAVQMETTDREPPASPTIATANDDLVIVRGPASAILCWLLGRAPAAVADLEVTRGGQGWQLPRLRAWA